MSFATKELNKYQDALHENLLLLTMEIPPSKDFQSIFKRNMFAKSNKAAFHHVMHYLLSITHPLTIKQKIPSWPILEVKMETQFRNEVFKCVNELNSTYEDADIPPMMSSHFVSPGGPKFIKFMFKLSQLALLVHVVESGKYHTGRIKSSDVIEYKELDGSVVKKQIKPQLGKIKLVTKEMQNKCIDVKSDFSNTLKKYLAESEVMQAEKKRLRIQIPHLEAKLKELESSNITAPSIKDCMDEINVMREKITKNNRIRETFDGGISLMQYLLGKDSCLEYQPFQYKIPVEVMHVIKSNAAKLDINNLLEAFMQFIEKKRFDIKEVPSEEVAGNHELFSKSLQDLIRLSEDLDNMKKDCNVLVTKLSNYDENVFVEKAARRQIIPEIIVVDTEDSANSTLATPLPDYSS